MKRNLYPGIVCSLLCFFVSLTLTANSTHESPLIFQSTSSAFVSKPANNSTGNPAPYLKVTANVVTDAKRYTIELNTAADFTGVSFVRTSAKDFERTLFFTGLAYSSTYYARVKTDLSPAWGKITKFQTRAEMFPAAVLPAHGAAGESPAVLKVTVGNLPDARRYVVDVSTDATFGSFITLQSMDDGQRDFIFKNLKYSARYYVRVKSDINTRYGPVTQFTTRARIAQKRLWGVTTSGGAQGFGTIFSFSIDSGTFTHHHDYVETSDYPVSYAHGTLTPAPDGGFYGNSECANGGTCGNGEVFYISPMGAYEMRAAPGIHAGNLMLASNNSLYVLHDWINSFRGGIIRLHADSSGFELSDIIFRFSSRSHGLNPKAALLEHSNGYLYGMAPYGGNSQHGVIYRLRHDGTGFQVIHHFQLATTGGYPQSGLLLGSDGYLYGTTSAGGSANAGTLFKIRPDGTVFTKVFDFTGITGKSPQGTLAERNGILFGTASAGGAHGFGVLFRINRDGSGFRKLLDFTGENGSTPVGAVTPDTTGYLYGMTSQGGAAGRGVIFKIKTDGSAFVKLFDFTSESGGFPDGSLTLVEDLFAPTANNSLAAADDENAPLAEQHNVGVFPNPFLNTFTAEVTSQDQQSVQFVLTDMHGQVRSRLYGDTNMPLEFGANLERGIYVLKVIRGDQVSQHRVVKR